MSKRANAFLKALKTPVTAKRLVLSLFGALPDETLPISKLVVGGSVFGIEETAVRMAANRLVNEGVLSLQDRGWYGIGEHGKTLYEASRSWQRQNDRLREWTGDWICVHVAHLGRSNRQALRARDRAFVLFGFAELEKGLWVRPGNLSLSTEKLANELKKLGLEEGAVVFKGTELVLPDIDAIHSLWDRKVLESGYRSALTAMARSEAKLDSKRLTVAAREVQEIGAAVVSLLTHDPLLPEYFVDASLRLDVHNAMLSYDVIGKSIWIELFSERVSGERLTAAE